MNQLPDYRWQTAQNIICDFLFARKTLGSGIKTLGSGIKTLGSGIKTLGSGIKTFQHLESEEESGL